MKFIKFILKYYGPFRESDTQKNVKIKTIVCVGKLVKFLQVIYFQYNFRVKK